MSIDNLMTSPVYKEIEGKIESFVKEKLSCYCNAGKITAKTIHDPIWGSVEYSKWEMQLIDSPLFQRLRDINQVGLAMLTYPSARHSRFEHSLGVTAAAKKMCEKIFKGSGSPQEVEHKNKIYLAALLHDIGHGFYSHLSEQIYKEFKEIQDLLVEFNGNLNRRPKAHEALAFIIINTKTFKDFFRDKIKYPEPEGYEHNDNLFQDVGRMIIGAPIKNGNQVFSYLTAIINGPFDVDKLDYIKRDSHTAGLSLTYDIERLFTKVTIYKKTLGKDVESRLVVKFNGVTAIEELAFCRIMLFSYIYYHQKVLISEAMMKDYVYGLHKLDVIKDISDFLRYTDSDILKLAENQEAKNPFPGYCELNLKELATKISHRKLPKRCLEVSRTNIENIEVADELDLTVMYKELHKKAEDGISFEEFQKEIESVINAKEKPKETLVKLDLLIPELVVGDGPTFEDLLDLRKELFDELVVEYDNKKKAVDFNMFDIYIIFPRAADPGITDEKVILGRDNTDTLKVSDFVNLEEWAASFNTNKWRGYVFVSEHIDRKIAYQAAEKFILKGKAKLKNPEAYLKI